jgi:hypothetical protein
MAQLKSKVGSRARAFARSLDLSLTHKQATARLKSKVGSCYEEASRLLEKAFSSRENSSAALRVAVSSPKPKSSNPKP